MELVRRLKHRKWLSQRSEEFCARKKLLFQLKVESVVAFDGLGRGADWRHEKPQVHFGGVATAKRAKKRHQSFHSLKPLVIFEDALEGGRGAFVLLEKDETVQPRAFGQVITILALA